eukprot:UN23715
MILPFQYFKHYDIVRGNKFYRPFQSSSQHRFVFNLQPTKDITAQLIIIISEKMKDVAFISGKKNSQHERIQCKNSKNSVHNSPMPNTPC